jgi:hypothetical protein
MPAILIEPVFLSNPAEGARLADPSGARLDAIAQGIAEGTDVWLRSRGYGPIDVASRAKRSMTAQDPLLAPPRGSTAQVLGAAFALGASRPSDLWAYVREVYRLAPQIGLDPAVVIAQSALETGWWQSPAWQNHLNPAGIGVTGDDVTSPTWQSGVDAARGHLVHLYLYAVGPVPAGHPLAPFIALDPRYAAALDAGRAGSARVIADLAGSWAIDPHYAESIARVGNDLFSGR